MSRLFLSYLFSLEALLSLIFDIKENTVGTGRPSCGEANSIQETKNKTIKSEYPCKNKTAMKFPIWRNFKCSHTIARVQAFLKNTQS